jgi:hypothetical protein
MTAPPNMRTRRSRGLVPTASMASMAFIAFIALCSGWQAPAAMAAPGAAWPTVALPPQAQVIDVSPETVSNGTPTRTRGFVVNRPLAEVADWYRRQLGQPFVENTAGASLVLGRAEADFYTTVQLMPAGGGTRGLVAVANLAAMEERKTWRQAVDSWQRKLPAGSRVLQYTTSVEGAMHSTSVQAVNEQSEETNGAYLREALVRQGFRMERELADTRNGAAHGHALFFTAAGQEAAAAITRLAGGRTHVLLHITRRLAE